MDLRPAADDSVVFDFAAQLLDDEARGETRSLAHYLARFPDHEAAVAREYLAWRYPAGARRAEEDSGAGTDPAPAAPAPEGPRLGAYALQGELGRGGQATVHLALDTRLGRRVALKILRSPLGLGATEQVERMRREAEIVARLDHPGLCQAYEACPEADPPYIAMRYVPGETFAAHLEAARAARRTDGPVPPAPVPLCPRTRGELHRTLAAFESVARALHAAHEAGVVHRDIKPGNLMVCPDGRPVVLDFGVAMSDDDSTLTPAGGTPGTPAYMSPEQLEPRDAGVDRRSDVFSLGACLYEALTLKPPFAGAGVLHVVEAVRGREPTSVSELNPTVPADVRAILAKALEKTPGRRYATALELAEDLRRVREFEPVRARPAGPGLRLARWFRRHPATASGVGAAFAGLVVALCAALVGLDRVRAERARAVAGQLRDASTDVLQRSPAEALVLALAAAEREPGYLSNQALLHALEDHHLESRLDGHERGLRSASFSPDGTRVLTTSSTGVVRVFGVDTGTELAELRRSLPPALTYGAWSPDGRRVAVASAHGTWSGSLEGSAGLHRLGDPQGIPRALVFSAKGDLLVTGTDEGVLQARDARSGALAWELCHELPVAALSIAPDGGLVASFGGELDAWGEVRVLDLDDGSERARLLESDGGILVHRLEPGGDRLVTGSSTGQVRSWDLASGELQWSLRVPPRTKALDFTPDGCRLAVAFGQQGGGAWVVDAGDGSRCYAIGHDQRTVSSVVFDPTGRRLASGSYGGSVRVWHAADGRLESEYREIRYHVWGVVWHPSGERLLSFGDGPAVNLWVLAPYGPLVRSARPAPVVDVEFHPQGETALAARANGVIELWTLRGRTLAGELDHGAPLRQATWDRKGERILAVGERSPVRVFTPGVPTPPVELHVPTPPTAASFAPNARQVAVGTAGGELALFEAAGRQLAVRAAHAAAIGRVAFDPTGRWLATCGRDRAVRLWRASDTEQAVWRASDLEQADFEHVFEARAHDEDEVFDVAFSPDGRRLVFTCEDAVVRAVSLEALDAGAVEVTRGNNRFVRFDATGERLVLAEAWSGHVRILDTRTWAPESRDHRDRPFHHPHLDMVLDLATCPTRGLALTGGRDGEARLWDTAEQRILARYGPRDAWVTSVDLDPRGERVLLGYEDGRLAVWPVDLVAAARAASARGVDSERLLGRLGIVSEKR